MADFTADLQNFRPSFPFLPIDPLMEPINQITLENPTLMNLQSFMSNPSLFSHQAPDHISGNWAESLPFGNQNSLPEAPQPIVTAKVESIESKKRKTMDFSESSSGNSSPQASQTRINKRNNCGKGKRVKSNDEKKEKSKDVVHVRARRGQATDSHSLAERVRRGKINEKLKCLQDIVPGCYKTMGMAVMLDEIINYVQSLQNQVEFLSMKLTAASTYYDFNSETEAIETIQRAKAEEAKELERLMREAGTGYQGPSCFNY